MYVHERSEGLYVGFADRYWHISLWPDIQVTQGFSIAFKCRGHRKRRAIRVRSKHPQWHVDCKLHRLVQFVTNNLRESYQYRDEEQALL